MAWLRVLVVTCSVWLSVSAVAAAGDVRDELWHHNGMSLSWSSVGETRQIISVIAPGPSAQIGDVLFRGWKLGRRLRGRVRFAASGCDRSFDYDVSGWVSPDGNKAVLTGRRPIVRDCRIVERLVPGPGTVIVLTKGPDTFGEHFQR